VIHYQDAYTGGQSQILDFSPQTPTFTDSPLSSGRTWTDPYSNLTLAIGEASANGLDVTVSYGAVPCVAAAPSISFAPPSLTVAAGSSSSFNVTITNNDSSSCKSSVFGLSTTGPAGLALAISPASLTLAPKSSSSAVVSVSAAKDQAAAAYAVSVSANAGVPGSANATCNVTNAPKALTASLMVPQIP